MHANSISVAAIYRKTGGKNGKHAAVFVADAETAPVRNISAVSNMAVQIFEGVPHMPNVFRVIPSDLLSLNVRGFALIRSQQFLYAISGEVKPARGDHQVLLMLEKDQEVHRSLTRALPSIRIAVKALSKRAVSNEVEEED